jgi:hypothetical protein
MGTSASNGHRQRGIVMPLFVIGMVAMLAMAGLALDSGHMMLNKTRLQNTADAAALSAAKTLDETSDTGLATVEALRVFGVNAALPGHGELAGAYNGGGMSVTVQFSSTLNPFVPGTTPAQYVRVRATDMRLPAWFVRVVGVEEKRVGASAVAGPSPTLQQLCNIAPMMVCGIEGDENYGYQLGMPVVLKTAAAGGSFEVGPGNFQLIRLGNNPGAAVVREALAGNYDGCVEIEEDGDGSVETQPGNAVGPVAQGLNTRLGIYSGPMAGRMSEFPPDVITTQVSPRLTYNDSTNTVYYEGSAITDPDQTSQYYDRAAYDFDLESGFRSYNALGDDPPGPGAYGRRVLAVPVGDCSTTTNGQGTVRTIGAMCFHLLQEAVQQGNQAHVYGEFMGTGCGVTGNPGPDPVSGPGPYIIQLYKDPDGLSS